MMFKNGLSKFSETVPGLTFFIFSIIRTTPYKLGLFIGIIAVITTTVFALVRVKKTHVTFYSYMNMFFYLLAVLIIIVF